MSKGMYLNSKEIGFISKVLYGDICSTKVCLRTCKNDEDLHYYRRDLEQLISIYCKCKGITKEYLQDVFDIIDEFRKYTHVKSYGYAPSFEEIDIVEINTIYTVNGSQIGWGLEERSAFVDNIFYPYGIDRKDVFLEFKNL